MFVDEARLRVVAGSGGDGCVSFRREKFVARGGPDGGDGGDGGDIVLLVEAGRRTLLHLRHQTLFSAEEGRPGEGKQCSGRQGKDCVIPLPPGTVVRDASSGAWVADLVEPGTRCIVAHGGRGGKGNTHFKSATRRTPRIATPGGEGEARELTLELKLLADVGLVGLPNVGKSTLLARVSNARPKIGDYPFTTLQPNLGIVGVDEEFSFVMADIPGLVEGAHVGRGLGIRFLKHIERTRTLLFLIDSIAEDPAQDLKILRAEIARFSPLLAQRPHVLGMSRGDLRPPGWSVPQIDGELPLLFSAHTGAGVPQVLSALRAVLETQPLDPALLQELWSEEQAPGETDEEKPFAWRIDAGEPLGALPWPQRTIRRRFEEAGAETESPGR